eukprot:Clim_evm67s243 gene=Clim_evmTU67s243
MSTERADLLLQYAQTFDDLSQVPDSVESLASGVVLYEMMSEVAPDYFDSDRINAEVDDNWRLRKTNINRLTKGLSEYYSEQLGYVITKMPSEHAIARDSSLVDIEALFELVIGATMLSKQEVFIARVLQQSQAVQKAVMEVTQELMHTRIQSMEDVGVDEPMMAMDGEQLKSFPSELADENQELKNYVSQLERHVAELESKIEKRNPGIVDTEGAAAVENIAKEDVEALQTALDDTEAQKEQIRQEMQGLKQAYQGLERENKELKKELEASKSLRDELDVLRHQAKQSRAVKIQLEKSQRRIIELEQQLEDNVNATVGSDAVAGSGAADGNIPLQRQIQGVRKLLDVTQEKVVLLEKDKKDLEFRLKEAAFEMQRLREGVRDSEGMNVTDSAMVEGDPMIDDASLAAKSESSGSADVLRGLSGLSGEQREARLRSELKQALSLSASRHCQVEELRAQLHHAALDANRLNSGEAELKHLQTKVAELTRELQAIDAQLSAHGVRRDHIGQVLAKANQSDDSQRAQEGMTQKEQEIVILQQQVQDLREMIRLKDVAQAHEKKTEPKALRTERSSMRPGPGDTFDEDYRRYRDREDRLMTTAWYNVVMELEREKRLAGSKPFLVRARRAAHIRSAG